MTCKLEIVEGRALLPMDLNGKSDPYVVIFFGGFNIQQKRTSTRYTTLKPMWNETFYFVGGEDGMDTIRLEVWDEDTMTRDDYMGEVAFTACVSTLSDPSGDVEQGPMHEGDRWFDVKRRDKNGELETGEFGQIRVRWLYSRTMSLLSARDNAKPMSGSRLP